MRTGADHATTDRVGAYPRTRGQSPSPDALFLVLSAPDVARLRRVETILKSEAMRRHTSVGWALYLMMVEAADLDAYPTRVRNRIMRLHAAADRQHARASERGAGAPAGSLGATAVSGRNPSWRVKLPTPECHLAARAILAYEAAMRGLTRSQAACALVEEAARAWTWTYPAEAQARLDKLTRGVARRATELALREMGEPTSGRLARGDP